MRNKLIKRTCEKLLLMFILPLMVLKLIAASSSLSKKWGSGKELGRKYTKIL